MLRVLTTVVVLVALVAGCDSDVVEVPEATMTGTWEVEYVGSARQHTIIALHQNNSSLQGECRGELVTGNCTSDGKVSLGFDNDHTVRPENRIRITLEGTVNSARTEFVGIELMMFVEYADTISVEEFTATKRSNK